MKQGVGVAQCSEDRQKFSTACGAQAKERLEDGEKATQGPGGPWVRSLDLVLLIDGGFCIFQLERYN